MRTLRIEVSRSSYEKFSAVSSDGEFFIRRYADDYQTIKVLGKGGFGYVFEAINKLDGRHLAVKRVSFKKCVHFESHVDFPTVPVSLASSDREQEKALNEVRALVQLDHPCVIRYIQAWIETPPLGWQSREDRTYDWRDLSR